MSLPQPGGFQTDGCSTNEGCDHIKELKLVIYKDVQG